MKRNILFKTLIDVLFIMHCLGFAALIFMLPFGVIGINMPDVEVANWSFMHWLSLIVGVFAYIFFLIALFHLRKTARFILSNNYFTESIIKSLKKSGQYFLAVSILTIVMFIAFWFVKLATGTFSIVYNVNIITTLLLAIVGLFFIIQSDVLLSAKGYKEENELTI